MDPSLIEKSVIATLGSTLQLGDRMDQLTVESQLLGEIPELDSMAVISVITALEEQFGVMFDDDEIGADTFETVGSLIQLVSTKTGAT